MHIRNMCQCIAVFALAALLVLSASVTFPALQAQASDAAQAGVLLGTGASDEINIVKILDMALNKAGISMSPSKIREFLQYWWSSVSSDMQTLMNDADTTITTVSDFVDYVASLASDPTKADGLEMVQLTLKFARFCAVQDVKTLADYKKLITQEGTFREFLLSYVTDQDSNITGSISNNKLVKYQLKPGFISMVRQAADAYINEYEGYYLVKTHKPSDLTTEYFSVKTQYDELRRIINTIDDDMVIALGVHSSNTRDYYLYDLSDSNFVFVGKNQRYIQFNLYKNDWSISTPPRHVVSFSRGVLLSGGGISLSEMEQSDVYLNQFTVKPNLCFS